MLLHFSGQDYAEASPALDTTVPQHTVQEQLLLPSVQHAC